MERDPAQLEPAMRIVSLLPAATEWICAFGQADALVGRSHECDHPPEVQDRPVLTAPAYEEDGDSAAINDAVDQQVQAGLSLYDVDLERLRALDPDVIVTQDQCDVCAVSRSGLEARLADWIGERPTVFSMQPATLKGVLDAALRLARTLGCLDRALPVIGDREADLRALRERIGVDRRTEPETLPSVACIEWMQPLMVAGHWMPDVVAMAGGRPVLATAGEPTSRVDWAALREADPDVLACMPCGFPVEETRRDLHYLTDRPGWSDLAAVQHGRVALLDGNAYFNRPGPRLHRAIAVLATVLYPDLTLASAPAPWERQSMPAAARPGD
jgi:iron complex transport system substrate-binding protein